MTLNLNVIITELQQNCLWHNEGKLYLYVIVIILSHFHILQVLNI